MRKTVVLIVTSAFLLSACSSEGNVQPDIGNEKLKEEIKEIIEEIELEKEANKVDLGGLNPWDYYDDVEDFKAENEKKLFFDMSDAEEVEDKTIEEAMTGVEPASFGAYLSTFLRQTRPDEGSEYHDVMHEANIKLVENELDEVVELVKKAKGIRESAE